MLKRQNKSAKIYKSHIKKANSIISSTTACTSSAYNRFVK